MGLVGRRRGTLGTAALGFHRGALDGEAGALGGAGKGVADGVVVDLRHLAAAAADQELGGVGVLVETTDEGGQALHAVDDALGEQEVEGAVYGRRRGAAAVGAKAVEQLVGADRGLGLQDQAEDEAAQVRQAGVATPAQRGGAVELRLHGGAERRGVGFGVHRTYLCRRLLKHKAGSMGDAILETLHFDEAGLVAAVAQQHDTGEVLMLAWMSRDAVVETLATGRVCYWSRSRRALWRKGETSGQVQRLVEMRLDCDGDALLLLVDQHGVACHTGRRSCFYRAARDGGLVELMAPEVAPEVLYPSRAG